MYEVEVKAKTPASRTGQGQMWFRAPSFLGSRPSITKGKGGVPRGGYFFD